MTIDFPLISRPVTVRHTMRGKSTPCREESIVCFVTGYKTAYKAACTKQEVAEHLPRFGPTIQLPTTNLLNNYFIV